MTQLAMFEAAAAPHDPAFYAPPPKSPELDEIIVDSFAGGGGASEGIRLALGYSPHKCINHKPSAIAMHMANHPDSEHFLEDVWKVDPITACDGKPVGLMWLSPDCTHFSKAKGKKPLSNKRRGLAWVAIRWAAAVRPRVIILENVEEFEQWGPILRETSRPCPKRKGQTFRAFVRKLKRFGYAVEWKQLRGCDYGTPELGVSAAPTTRKRLFLIARCDGLPIVWPKPTHGPGRAFVYRTAADCIDWSIPCYSIFLTKRQATALRKKYGIRIKRPLVVKTKRRVARGVVKFVINNPRPFIVPMTHANAPTSVDGPLQTVTTQGNKFNLVTPFITKFRTGSTGSPIDGPLPTVTANSYQKRPGGAVPMGLVAPILTEYHSGEGARSDDRARSLDAPLSTQDTSNRFGLIAPFLAPVNHAGDDRVHSVEDPMRTVTGARRGEISLAAPFLVPRYGEDPHRNNGAGQPPRSNSVEQPMPTIVPDGNGAQLVSAFLAKHFGDRGQLPGSDLFDPVSTVTPRDHHSAVAVHMARFNGDRLGGGADEPLGTVMASTAKHALVASSLVKLRGTSRHGQPIDQPAPAITAGGNHVAHVAAFLQKYHGTQKTGQDLFAPMKTIDTRDRFSLVLVTVGGVDYVIVDIGMRMLVPRELFRAQGFRDSYIIDVEVEVQQKYRRKGRIMYRTVRRMLTKEEQTDMVGNSVNPTLACALVYHNYAPGRVREAVA